MKVNSTLQNAVSDMMQNLQTAVQETRKQTAVSKIAKKTVVAKENLQKPGSTVAQKVKDSGVSESFANLSATEQTFFEDLYPKARKEIRAYITQQKNVSHVKGRLFDAKG